MNNEFFMNIVYIISSVLFAFGLKFLGSPVTARRGNMLSALGMLLAVLATLCNGHIISFQWILIGHYYRWRVLGLLLPLKQP